MFYTFFICWCLMASAAFAVEKTMRYVALGDSYTIGTGVQVEESWPAVVTVHLQNKGVPIQLVANLGHNGWTSQNLIDGELTELRKLNPDIVTVLIGANDWVQGVDAGMFQKNFRSILDELLKTLDPQHILVVTIPDFSVTPLGQQFSYGRDIAQGIKEFNGIIIKEAQARGLKIADLYPLSRNMGQDRSLISQDGLHPSAQGYAQWANFIEPFF